VNRVDVVELAFVADDMRYEASFVFLLPDAVGDAIRRVQDEWALKHGTPAQPSPHLTLQYLGVCDGAKLRGAHKHFEGHVPQPPTVLLEGCSSFVERGIVRNVHIVVESSADLQGIRESVRKRYLELPWAFAALRDEWPFKPHISILEGVTLSDVPEVTAGHIPAGLVPLARAAILARQVGDLR
jgi:2'-5' RNA ligase